MLSMYSRISSCWLWRKSIWCWNRDSCCVGGFVVAGGMMVEAELVSGGGGVGGRGGTKAEVMGWEGGALWRVSVSYFLSKSPRSRKKKIKMPSHKTFIIKKKLGKKMRQNRPIPHWIRLRTDNKIRYNAKRRHWRRTKLGF
ncbi:hypothetical protein ACLB2K_009291 [Fragaria x ananassa]